MIYDLWEDEVSACFQALSLLSP